MKILCSADYHIKLKTKNIPEDWARNRYRLLFKKLSELEQEVELHLVMGDWFDRMPSLEELELFYEFVASRVVETIIISGNHEALKKNTTFLSYLKNITTKLNPLVRIIDDFYEYKGIDFIPYNKLKEYSPKDIDFRNQVLVTHVRGSIPPHVKPEVNLELFSRWKTVLAGDLHSYENCQLNILYPGSPVTTSFHRNKVESGVIVFDSTDHTHNFIPLGMPQLLRKTVKAGDAMEPTYPDHTIYEVEGDLAELSNIKDSDLLDKKVVTKSTEASLNLSDEMTVEEEMVKYMREVLNLDNETIEDCLKEFHDNIKDIGV